jgi:hypothetical protein
MLQAARHRFDPAIITRVLHFRLKNAGTRHFIFSLISLLIVPAALGASRNSATERRTSQAAAVRDESYPDDPQYCQGMGQLQISYHTEGSGEPGVGVIITDPRGRRIGYDPIVVTTWQELPFAEAFVDCEEEDETPRKCRARIQVCGPVSGAYKVQVVASERGTYWLEVSAVSAETRDGQQIRTSDSHAEVNGIAIDRLCSDALVVRYSRELDVGIEVLREKPRVPLP